MCNSNFNNDQIIGILLYYPRLWTILMEVQTYIISSHLFTDEQKINELHSCSL